MAQHSGFFNALESEGNYDRKYNADDYTSNMAAIISSGVRRSAQNDLRVTASGLVLTVGSGRAWIDGRWYYNDTALEIATVTPPTGSQSRVDGVYLHADSNLSVRSITLLYKAGTPSASPTAPACVRDGGIYEIMLASVLVAPNATSVTVTDKRPDSTVCGWITSPIGYSDYFENLDTEFNEWFADVKDKLASVTLFKQYIWSTTLTSSSDAVTFNIPQYDSTGVDIIQVYVNGLLEIPTSDYTLSGSVITFTQGKTAGTEINVICYKSIDGTGLGSVSDEITALQNAVAALGDVGQYYYFCTGSADNVAIYNAVSTFLSGGDDGKSLHLHICGNPGISAAILGSGTAASPYQWLAFGSGTSRKVILDFTNCGKWTITTASGTYNTVFSASANVTVKGITIKAGSSSVSSDIIGASSKMRFEDCDIEIEGASTSLVKFAGAAELVNCKISVTNGLGNAAVIGAADSTLSTVNGGKLYAYTGESSGVSAIVYIPAGVGGKVAASMVQMPVVAKTGFYQTASIYAQSGKVLSVGQLTTLTADIGGTAEDTIIGEM